jgi:hypothetical protein
MGIHSFFMSIEISHLNGEFEENVASIGVFKTISFELGPLYEVGLRPSSNPLTCFHSGP